MTLTWHGGEKQNIHHEQTVHNVDFAQRFVVFYIGCFWLFFRVDALRTRNRKEIQHNVSCVLSASHVRISLKSCNLRRSCKNYFRGIGDALHSSKIKSKWGAASITQLTQKLEKTTTQETNTIKIQYRMPTTQTSSQANENNERNMGERKRNMKG